jgi:hypothetical protein
LYDTEARVHVLPALGRKPVAGIQPTDLRKLYAYLSASGVGVPTIEIVIDSFRGCLVRPWQTARSP